MSVPISPLTEASERSLDEYFARKPPYDSETLAKIKTEFRRMRELWARADATGSNVRAKKAAKSPVSKDITIDLFAAEETPK